MDFKVIAAVAADAEPVTLEEARLQCKVDPDDTSFDLVLGALCVAAREFAEHYTGLALAPRTLEAPADAFPAHDGAFDLPMPPVTSITSIKYTDEAGAEQTLNPVGYVLSGYAYSSTVSLTYGSSWPATRREPNAVRVRFACGYGDGLALPQAVKAALLLHVETESPLNQLTPAERERNEKARNSLLDTVKVWGR